MKRRNGPIVEYGGTSILTTESLAVHTTLAIFLSGIHHEWIRTHKHIDSQCRIGSEAIAGKIVARYALLVMVLEEVEHVVANFVYPLPCCGNLRCWAVAANHTTHCVVHSHLII